MAADVCDRKTQSLKLPLNCSEPSETIYQTVGCWQSLKIEVKLH